MEKSSAEVNILWTHLLSHMCAHILPPPRGDTLRSEDVDPPEAFAQVLEVLDHAPTHQEA